MSPLEVAPIVLLSYFLQQIESVETFASISSRFSSWKVNFDMMLVLLSSCSAYAVQCF